MAVPHPLPQPLVERIAARFRVLGDPMRIRLLEQLRDGDRTLQQLSASAETTEQTASKQLDALHGAGIVVSRTDGDQVVYSIADPTVFALCETVCGGLARQFAELDELLGSSADRAPR
jgi:DNA-binding transcriptional ArsR family regulator